MQVNYDDVTVKQIQLMQHAIGFSLSHTTGIKHRKMSAYRNRFVDHKNEDWESLVEKGLAEKANADRICGGGSIFYRVTPKGFAFLSKLTGISITESD